MRFSRLILAIFLSLAMISGARAQCIGGVTSNMNGATVATGGTFQSIIASSGTRKGCQVQYTGTGIGYVFFGPNGSATTTNSFQLGHNAYISCNVNGGLILTDNVSVTSATTSDTFVYNFN